MPYLFVGELQILDRLRQLLKREWLIRHQFHIKTSLLANGRFGSHPLKLESFPAWLQCNLGQTNNHRLSGEHWLQSLLALYIQGVKQPCNQSFLNKPWPGDVRMNVHHLVPYREQVNHLKSDPYDLMQHNDSANLDHQAYQA